MKPGLGVIHDGGHDLDGPRGSRLSGCVVGHDGHVVDELIAIVTEGANLMILPAGVTKATGLAQALVDLGLSPHSAVGIGDAENDHSLLESCELGVAVANAVDALKRHADLVLDETDGLGVAGFLRGPVVGGEQRIHPRRWHVHLGTTSSGEPVTVPASQVNVLITGASRSGKSYLTGLFAEQLIDLGYSVVLVDPEGDHTNLGLLPGVAVVGGRQGPPDADHLAHLVTQGRGSVVIDLSQMGTDAKRHLLLRRHPATVRAAGPQRSAALGHLRRGP